MSFNIGFIKAKCILKTGLFMTEKVIPKVVEEEMKQAYLAYSMSVIVGRALPDARDGLKPVHRRVLYSMNELGLQHNKPYKKCARIVGDCLGKYHPHGDMAVYDSLVRMAQSFSLRYPLIIGQGNFGSVDGDNAAAMRYTEAKLTKIAEEMLMDLEKETVDFLPNFDGSLTEPEVLPSKFPNLLVNGSSGIAVGMATSMPPHNLTEVCSAINAYLDNPQIETNEIMQHIQGPDFPTGGIIFDHTIRKAYTTGKGKVTIRAKAEIEKGKIAITEIPYMVNKSALIEQIAELVQTKKVEGIRDIRDESDKKGMRIVLELKQAANPEITLNQLYTHSRMQETFPIIMLSLVNGQPRVLPLKDLLKEYAEYRKIIITKRTQYELKIAQERIHIVLGLLTCLDNLDESVNLIKNSNNPTDAAKKLIEKFELSEKQAKAILEMKLSKLTALESGELRKEKEELEIAITKYNKILGDIKEIIAIIKQEVTEMKEKYGDARRTQIISEIPEIDEEGMVKPEDVAIMISHTGYAKRIPLEEYRTQKRGGKGVISANVKEEDFIETVITSNTLDNLIMLTNKGKAHLIKAYKIPEATRYARGLALVNLLKLTDGERVQACIEVKDFEQGYLFMATEKGTIKKTPLNEFSRPRAGGIAAIDLPPEDNLVTVMHTTGEQDIIIATANGMAVRFNEKDVRPMGRQAYGVRGIKLKENDIVIGAVKTEEEKSLLTISEKGYGKRTEFKEYSTIKRGGSGVKNLIVTDKNGKAISIKSVSQDDEILILSKDGQSIRTKVSDIREVGRAAQGVIAMKLPEGDSVIGVAIV